MPFRKSYVFLLLISCFSEEIMASDDDIKNILNLSPEALVNLEVVSASRFKQKLSEAPSAVEVVTAKDIRSFGWRTLADALNAMRGLNTVNDRNYSFLGVRGFSRSGDYGSRVLVMIDGRRTNDAVFDEAFIGEEFMLDMNLIERIEYMPGSGSSIYGGNALLGVINVITKHGKTVNGLKLSGEIGDLNTYRTRATYGKQWKNGADLLLNASQFFSHGVDQLHFSEFSDINSGIAQNMDQEHTKRLFGQFNYQNFTLRSGYISRYKRVPTASFGSVFNNNTFFTIDQQAYVDMAYNTQINAKLGLQVRGFHHWYDYHSTLPYATNNTAPAASYYLNYDASHTRWWGSEIMLAGTQFNHHKWLLGLDVQYDQHQALINYDINPYNLHTNTRGNGWRLGLHAQDEYHITDSLSFNMGLRLDYHHLLKTLQLHPRIGLVWDITPTFTTKLLYGSAFRAPNFYEQTGTIPVNTNNSQEIIKSYEAIAQWNPGKSLKLLGTLFFNDLNKVLEQSPVSASFINAGSYHMYGFELEAEKHWSNDRLFKFSWTHNEAQDQNLRTDNWATDSPKNMIKLHYTEPLFNNTLSLGFENIFVDARKTLTHNILPAYNLLNINVALTKPIYGFNASLGIYNALNEHYKIVANRDFNQDALAMNGRTVRFRIEYGF